MEKNKVSYQCIIGIPEKDLFEKITNLYRTVFEDAKLEFFKNRMQEKEKILVLLAVEEEEFIGFKIGYLYNATTFYSWIGGVLPNFRKKGIAQQLLQLQHTWAKENGFKKIRTKSMNQFKSMLILNIKNGFDITQVYTNSVGQTKIIFEKML